MTLHVAHKKESGGSSLSISTTSRTPLTRIRSPEQKINLMHITLRHLLCVFARLKLRMA